jgi:hypothetical protein
MFSIVTETQLALDGNYDRVSCLKHVGTEGFHLSTDLLVLRDILELHLQAAFLEAEDQSVHDPQSPIQVRGRHADV